MTHVIVTWVHLPHGVWGLTDGGHRVWLDARLGQAERRSTLAHELEHIRRGHHGCQPPAVEASVEHHAARRLIPDVHALADALVWARGHLGEAADELWVDVPTLRARLDPTHLHPAEVEILRRRLTDEEIAP